MVCRQRDRTKILVWQHTGFWLFYRRLEKGTFDRLVDVDAEQCVEVEARRLRLMLDGIALKQNALSSLPARRSRNILYGPQPHKVFWKQ